MIENANNIDSILKPILKRLNSVSRDVQASAILSRDGHSLATALGEGTDTLRLGAMCASTLSLAEKTALELDRGRLKQILIEGERGCILIVSIGSEAVLAVVARPSANLGMVFVEARKTAREIAARGVL